MKVRSRQRGLAVGPRLRPPVAEVCVQRKTAANYFSNGIKGRPDESQYPDHVCIDASYELETPRGKESVNLRNAMNEVMRTSYIKDCEIGVKRWNMQIQRAGYDLRLALPSPRFRRSIGAWANVVGQSAASPTTSMCMSFRS